MKTTGQIVKKVPRTGEWFEVNPKAINRQLFEEKREDQKQESTRQLILEAFAQVDNASKYQRCFETLVPRKTWKGCKKVKEHKAFACELGDRIANWVEEALE